MNDRRARLLDVGNCDPDHAEIRRMLEEHFRVDVDRVMFVDDAVARIASNRFDLVLVNRLIFADGSEGLELARRIRRDRSIQAPPIMLISNHESAQATAVAVGCVPGFGKAGLRAPATFHLLGQYLPAGGPASGN